MEEMPVVLQMRATTARIRDDGIKAGEIEHIELLAGKLPREMRGSVVAVEGATAGLHGWRHDLTAIRQQDVRRIPVHL